ncbi:carboxymuconolactone decarboxylase family protein [Burkholderia cepacia]|uniref:carboxymuconolactone decarboxylase family protein n=1 Tax=Burkholderia cepacia TaxID=292 RepID=UPI002AB73B31|nr:carboxymuconolactone decarboxylase family protein [Burkholderia cepacia]
MTRSNIFFFTRLCLPENIAPQFARFAKSPDICGYAYRRPGIDLNTRHLVTLGVSSAMSGCENQLRFQPGAALHLGISAYRAEQIREVFIARFCRECAGVQCGSHFQIRRRHVSE